MKQYSFLMVLLFSICFLINCKQSEINIPPVITNMKASPESIKTGQTTQVSCFVYSPVKEKLIYSWSSSGGSFSNCNNSSKVTWTAPEVPGEYIVTVAVNDRIDTDYDTAHITVEIIQGHGILEDPRDGRIYKTIILNDQEWMAENLAYLPEVNPPYVSFDFKPCYYVQGYEGNNLSEAKALANYSTYGVLYNWPAALDASPDGWHLPTDEEWKQLELAIGMNKNEVEKTGWSRGKNEGNKLKATNGWNDNGNGSDNFDFSGLPGGYFQNNSFEFLGRNGNWWSATENDFATAKHRSLNYYFSQFNRGKYFKGAGLSIRCVKD